MSRISELPTTAYPELTHEFPASLSGETHKLTVGQIRAILGYTADEITYGEGTVKAVIDQILADMVDETDLATAIAGLENQVQKAVVEEIFEGTNTTKSVTPKAHRDTAKFVATGAVPDLGLALNFTRTITGSLVFNAPLRAFEGASGLFVLTQGSGGGGTLGWDTFWDFGQAGVPTFPTEAGSVGYVAYYVLPGATKAICTFIRG